MGIETDQMASSVLIKIKTDMREKITTAIQDTEDATHNVQKGKRVLYTANAKEFVYKSFLYLLIAVQFIVIIGLFLLLV